MGGEVQWVGMVVVLFGDVHSDYACSHCTTHCDQRLSRPLPMDMRFASMLHSTTSFVLWR